MIYLRHKKYWLNYIKLLSLVFDSMKRRGPCNTSQCTDLRRLCLYNMRVVVYYLKRYYKRKMVGTRLGKKCV